MKILERKIDELKPAEYNPRILSDAQFNAIRESLKKYDFVDPIVVNMSTERLNTIVGGHQRVKVAKSLGFKTVPCVHVKLSLEDEKELNIRLNRNTGEWDWGILDDLFDKDDLLEWGFEPEDFDPIKKAGKTDPDDVPDPPKIAKTKLGDLYILGEHRLLCGDSTSERDVLGLMDGQNADMVFTDPPYNLNFKYNNYKDDKTRHEYTHFCESWLKRLTEQSESVIITPGKQNIDIWQKIADISDIGIWIAANKMSGGKISNLSLWEPILFIGKFDRNSRPNDIFNYNVKQQKGVGGHTCPKIIDLIADIVDSYSRPDDTVLDVFGGSGTTLIACEQTGRKCRMMELDPIYCDVIVKRWEDFTGEKAVLQK